MQDSSLRKMSASRAPAPLSLVFAGVLLAAALLLQSEWVARLEEHAFARLPTEAAPLALLLTYPFHHSAPLHLVFSCLGIWGVGRSVELMTGGWHLGAGLLLGALVGALAHAGCVWTGALTPESSLEGALPLLGTLLGMYSTILPGWRIGDASRWPRIPLKARTAGWAAAFACALWWFLGWFPRGGPLPSLAGLLAGWAYARGLGFGDRLFLQHAILESDALEKRIQDMDWEEFLARELNPVLEKIARQGLRSLNRSERRILRHSRRKLEGW